MQNPKLVMSAATKTQNAIERVGHVRAETSYIVGSQAEKMIQQFGQNDDPDRLFSQVT